jgi:hypothetical protein
MMAEDLSKLWQKFSLSEEESLVVETTDLVLLGAANRNKACLIGKLFADRTIGKDALKSALVWGWKLSGKTLFKALGDNICLDRI